MTIFEILSPVFTIRLDEFDEEQVFYGDQPFLKTGTDKHTILLFLVKQNGLCAITDIAGETSLEEDQIISHQKAINRDAKNKLSIENLINKNGDKFRLTQSIGQKRISRRSKT